MRHPRTAFGTAEGLEAVAHQVNIESAIDAAGVGHNGDS